MCRSTLLLALITFVAIFTGCQLNPSGNNVISDSLSISNVSNIDTLQAGETKLIRGEVKSSLEIDNNSFSFTIMDSDGKDAGKYFTITSKSFSPKKEVDIYSDLGLSIEALSTVPSGNYSFIITVICGNLSKSHTINFSVNNTSSTASVFPYYKDSEFIFVIKKGVSTVTTTPMTWTVTEYDSATKTATISNSVEPANSLPATFYFRVASNGGLEYSPNKSSWVNLTDPDNSSDVKFLFGTKAAKPSSLLGSVANGVKTATVKIPEGTSSGLEVYSKYQAGHNDAYFYSDHSEEQYCDVGFAYSSSFTSDQSDYPPFTSKRVIELVSYKIYLPDGNIKEAGQLKPDAPSNLSASYIKNQSTWNSSTGTYEKRTYVSLTWKDNSDNETQFNLYIKVPESDWKPADEAEMNNQYKTGFSPSSFPSNTYSGSIKAGYYVNWVAGVYKFKITAATLFEESDYSNEATIWIY